MAPRLFFRDNDAQPHVEGTPAVALPYSEPRALTAGVEHLDISKPVDRNRRKAHEWQNAAWQYADQIGEIKYAFGLTANISSRARFYAGLIDNNDEPPTDVESFLKGVESVDSEQHATKMVEAAKIADEAIRDLFRGGQARLTRILALNLQVTGEAYLIDNYGQWDIASINEIQWGNPPKLQRSRYTAQQGGQSGGGTPLKQGAYVARVYREHARFAQDADSSMLGVLDSCEQVVLFDQMMRHITRSRLAADVWAIPAGTVSLNGKPIDEAIREMVQEPITDESSLYSVAPLILQMPEGGKLEKLELGRKVDDAMISLQENYMQRILDGLDIPKDMVSGLEGVRYSNALAVNDNYYKGHIEPLIVLISDVLTYAYLRPMLHKAGVEKEIIERFVVWYNPSAIVTRPDRSASADTGYQQKLISASAWRRAHGYSEHDAPDDDEILRRLAMDRVVIPPDMSPVLLESLNPAFFAKARQEGQANAGIPSDVANLLDGGTGTGEAAPEIAPSNEEPLHPVTEEDAAAIRQALSGPSEGGGNFTETQGQIEATSGGDIPQGGTMPPRPR